MKKKILVVQLRSKPYADHEKTCFKRNVGKFYQDIHWLNIYGNNKKLPKTIKELQKYSCVIISGTGEYSLSNNDDRTAIKPPKKLINLMKLIALHDFPFFGLCFGHHLLGYILGTKVTTDKKQEEVGSYKLYLTKAAKKDKLLSQLNKSFYVQEGHNDVLTNIPKDCVLLGSTKKCKVHALRYKNNIYSVQFHADMRAKESWERDELYAKLNPDLGYVTMTKEKKDSKDQTRLLNQFLSFYHK